MKFKRYFLTFLALLPVGGGLSLSARDLPWRDCAGLFVNWNAGGNVNLTGKYILYMKDDLRSVDIHYFALGADYMFSKYFKAGTEYIYFEKYSASGDHLPRLRLSLNATGTCPMDNWSLSLYERLQLTHKPYHIDDSAEVKNLVQIRSRLTLRYKGWDRVAPFTYVELRHSLNDLPTENYGAVNLNMVCLAAGLNVKVTGAQTLILMPEYKHFHTTEYMMFCLGYRLSF